MHSSSRLPLLAPEAVRLILVRHGEVAANREFRYLGSRDDALTEQGHAQAQRLAEALQFLPISAVYSSPRRRTVDTATPIAAACGLAVQTREALRETSYGAWEGLSRAELLGGDDEVGTHLHGWERDPTVAPPGGESIAETEARVALEVEELRLRHAGQSIVLVSHVGPIKSVVRRALGLPCGSGGLFLDPATISVVDWGTEASVLRLFNGHGHLGWENARWITG